MARMRPSHPKSPQCLTYYNFPWLSCVWRHHQSKMRIYFLAMSRFSCYLLRNHQANATALPPRIRSIVTFWCSMYCPEAPKGFSNGLLPFPLLPFPVSWRHDRSNTTQAQNQVWWAQTYTLNIRYSNSTWGRRVLKIDQIMCQQIKCLEWPLD